jgi:hypothetical protein
MRRERRGTYGESHPPETARISGWANAKRIMGSEPFLITKTRIVKITQTPFTQMELLWHFRK